METQTQSLERANAWSEALLLQWWQRMAQIFGRVWLEQFGHVPSRDWRVELGAWSVPLAAAVLVHYRRAGLKFPPNLSEVAKLAHDLKPGLEPPPPPREYEPNESARARARDQASLQREITAYVRKHPGATLHEACLAYLSKRRLISVLPESVRAKAVTAEAELLRREATAATARTKTPDIEDALEAHEERNAIQGELDPGSGA